MNATNNANGPSGKSEGTGAAAAAAGKAAAKKVAVFRPVTKSRYLPGEVDIGIQKSDMVKYNEHRYNVFFAKCKVDCAPPTFHALAYLKNQKLLLNEIRLRHIDRENKDMLKRINKINRTSGKVDSFNPRAYVSLSRWRMKQAELEKIEKENRKIFKRLLQTKAIYSKASHDQHWQHFYKKLLATCRYPLVSNFEIKTKDDELKALPSISEGLQYSASVIRPKCFFEFQAQNGIKIGKIIIELYSDCVPVTVANFLAICNGENGLTFKNCPVHRIYSDQYCISGDITKGNGKGGKSIYGDTFKTENFKLKHAKPGVLSMVTFNKHDVHSQFIITFDKAPQFDGKFVVFGKVIKGAKNIYKISDLGRETGVPVTKVTIKSCGQFTKNVRI